MLVFQLLCFVLVFSILLGYIYLNMFQFYLIDEISGYEEKPDNRTVYSENYEFVINNNIAQYSSYIIKDKDRYGDVQYRIEVFVVLNNVLEINYGDRENFKCILKISQNVVELDVIDMPKLFRNKESKKFVFILDNKKIQKFRQKSFHFNESKVAVIWKSDFDKNLKKKRLNILSENNKRKRVVLSYSLIKFQIPTVIELIEPRLPSIGFCVHYVYKFPLALQK